MIEYSVHDKPISKLSPFAIHKGVMVIAGSAVFWPYSCGMCEKGSCDNLLCANTLAGSGQCCHSFLCAPYAPIMDKGITYLPKEQKIGPEETIPLWFPRVFDFCQSFCPRNASMLLC